MENLTPNSINKDDDTLLLPQKEKKKLTCDSVLCWILQIILWIGVIILFYIDFYDENEYYKEVSPAFIAISIIESFFYVIYVCQQFSSPTYKYLRHKKNEFNLEQKMKQYFITPPKIEFTCICYHYESKTTSSYDINGDKVTKTETRKVISSTNTKYFYYYSSRDVSGLFKLNYDESSISNKYYVKLELFTDVGFADAETYNDFLKEKEEFYNSNLHKDMFMDFYISNIIDGMNSYNLINLTENNPCGMSVFWYVFFCLIGIAQIYKSYINSKSVYKSFTIRKIISSRYSLTTEECDRKYKRFNPAISFEEDNIQLTPNEIGYISEDFQLKEPTQEEIASAQQYKDKIFNISDYIKDNGTNLEININKIEEKNIDIDNSESNNGLEMGLLPK